MIVSILFELHVFFVFLFIFRALYYNDCEIILGGNLYEQNK